MIISKEFQICYGHQLPTDPGKCRRSHGHNGRLIVYVEGDPKKSGPEEGMVINFTRLKEIVKELVVDKWDHHFLACGDEVTYLAIREYNRSVLSETNLLDLNCELVGVRTTAENLARIAFKILREPLMQNGVDLSSIEFWETDDNLALYTEVDFINETGDIA